MAAALAEETNLPRRPLPGHPNYTFELIRHDAALPAGRDPGCAGYTESVVAGALKIFSASFAPLILEDGRDMCGDAARTHAARVMPSLTHSLRFRPSLFRVFAFARARLELVCNSFFDAEGDDPHDFSASLRAAQRQDASDCALRIIV